MADKLKVLSIFGTRPEAVKMAPVVRALEAEKGIHSRVCVTAQHRGMLDQVLGYFDIHPDVDLDLMKPDQSLAGLTASIFTALDPVLQREKPDWVLVQGDTTTVMASALNAYYREIRVGHVEAGLRTFDKWAPFPEEINRKIAGTVADLHFAPTALARENLLREGVPDRNILVTGNPVIDAVHWVAEQPVPPQVRLLLDELNISDNGNRLVLVTAHRRENFDEPIEHICAAINRLADEYAGRVKFVYPVHQNPHIQGPVHTMLGGNQNITLLPPVEYPVLINLLRHATLALTDSGGIQEEAPGFGIPALVLRDVTERPEGVTAGVLQLVGTNTDTIYQATRRLLDDPAAYQSMARAVNPFGDGKAAGRIVQALLKQPARQK
jgi:UDP-N-acetylglucosamine 2-epimerase (non-hydrolysing)